MILKLILNYWEELLLLSCLIPAFIHQFQLYILSDSLLFSFFKYIEFILYLFLPLIPVLGVFCCSLLWLVQVCLITSFAINHHRLKYSPLKMLIKMTAIPIILVWFIFRSAHVDLFRLKLSENTLLNCVKNPSACHDITRIGWFYIYRIWREPDLEDNEDNIECTFFATDTWMLSEWGIAYVVPGKESCVNCSISLAGDKIYDNWWEFYYDG